jgi:DNA (cytosine-5)-methyltransferase 1
MRAVDLFCGAGGSSLGLTRAGFDVIGFDHWRLAVDTHNANGMKCHWHDLCLPELDDLIEPHDLLWASPPCQPFSRAGEMRGEWDDRDGFPWMLRIVAKRLPAVVIAESTRGLTYPRNVGYLAQIRDDLAGLGYDVRSGIVDTADLGLPQSRQRTIIVARRDGGTILFPTNRPRVHMAEALGWPQGEYILDYRRPSHGARNTVDVSNRPAPTLTTQSAHQWVINDTMRFTEAECAMLQGFPPDFVWTGSKKTQAHLIGNACPPILAETMATLNLPKGDR